MFDVIVWWKSMVRTMCWFALQIFSSFFRRRFFFSYPFLVFQFKFDFCYLFPYIYSLSFFFFKLVSISVHLEMHAKTKKMDIFKLRHFSIAWLIIDWCLSDVFEIRFICCCCSPRWLCLSLWSSIMHKRWECYFFRFWSLHT